VDDAAQAVLRDVAAIFHDTGAEREQQRGATVSLDDAGFGSGTAPQTPSTLDLGPDQLRTQEARR
jgi:hypothetical protein